MFEDILGKDVPQCPDCNRDMKEVDDYFVCPNGCWEYHDGTYKVGIGS